jgi:cell division protein FtsB
MNDDDFDYSELRARRQTSWLNAINGVLRVFIFLAAIGTLVVAYVPQFKKKKETEAHVEQLKAELAKQKELLARRKREEDLLKNDPQYLETVARDKLDLMKEGEIIIRIEPTSAPKRTP